MFAEVWSDSEEGNRSPGRSLSWVFYAFSFPGTQFGTVSPGSIPPTR